MEHKHVGWWFGCVFVCTCWCLHFGEERLNLLGKLYNCVIEWWVREMAAFSRMAQVYTKPPSENYKRLGIDVQPSEMAEIQQ